MALDSALLQSLEWRCIGPHRGGRVVAVAGDPVNPMVFYFGACTGGVWKTDDGGTYWENVSDGYFRTAAVGAIAVADADPNVIYAGMGEACIRNDVSSGDGVYRSTDGGKTWQHIGLGDSRHIGRIRVHPKNPDLVYVAALGHAWAANDERGVFRSRDGGASWEKVLFRSPKAGAVDLSMDPHNPRILYAAMWEAFRLPWTISSGGPDSALYQSTDGGDTWTDLSDRPGMPRGLKGRIGVAVSPAQHGRVWAMIEAEQGGLYRSDDGGATWEMVNNTDGRGRPWYHTHVFADPLDPETVWVMDSYLYRSTDGGRTFREVPAPHGDHHDLWIDPVNPRRMINGHDGGASVTFNDARSWSSIYNQPTACFYHLAVDNQFPYRVYGTQQDNTAISVPSRTSKGYIPLSDCYMTGTSESGHIAVRPDNPNIVYSGAIGSSAGGGGNLLRSDHAAGDNYEIITVWPEETWGWAPQTEKYRFHWTYPIVISPHDPNVLYITGNLVFRTTDEGKSWEILSPDLTRNDPTKLELPGGPITVQGVSGAETYCTIFAFTESPHERGVFWAGTDDGLIHLSRNGGQTWENVTPPDLPEWTTVATIEVSPHDPATAHVAAYRYKLDDYRPYVYVTADYGKSWRTITSGIADDDFVRVVREDPARRGLLYAGTETGVYVSFDSGAAWHRVQSNLPVVPIYDLAIKDNDLVVATHGRSFWILDDLTPLRQLTPAVSDNAAHLFTPRRTYQELTAITFEVQAVPAYRNYTMAASGGVAFRETRGPTGVPVRSYLDAGDNPRRGVAVSYLLKDRPQGTIALTFLDAAGNEIRGFTSKPIDAEAVPGPEKTRDGTPAPPPEPQPPAEPGLNRFVWDMRYPPPVKLPDDPMGAFRSPDQGPEASPGPYQVRLTVDGRTYTERFEIAKDPRITATREDLDERFALLIQIRDKLSVTHAALLRLRAVRRQVEEWEQRAGEASSVGEAAKRLKEQLKAIEEELIQMKAKTRSDFLRYPVKLNAKIRALASVPASAPGAPTRQTYDVFNDLSARIDMQVKQLEELTATEVVAFNDLIRQTGVPAIVPMAAPRSEQPTAS